MMRKGFLPAVYGWGVLAIGLFCSVPADGSCREIDFEGEPIGAPITSLYPGVDFSVLPQSCFGTPQLFMRVANAPAGGTSSGSQVLAIDTGCPSFSSDFLRMDFEDPQNFVRFSVGESTGAAGWDFQIRYYDDGGLLGSFVVTSIQGINRTVTIGSAGGPWNIHRVEVEQTVGGFEVIDDLQFGIDESPPTALITSPAPDVCLCGIIAIRGIACDEDGTYAYDQLEVRRVDAEPDAPWEFQGSFASELCAVGTIYTLDTNALSHGAYYLRVTVFNTCGASSSAITTIFVDKEFDEVQLRSPASTAIVGGDVCFDGTVQDSPCFNYYTIQYTASDSGEDFVPINPDNAQYDEAVVNDPLGTWQTAALELDDGEYEVLISGSDMCGNVETIPLGYTVDNTPPVAELISPESCSEVEGIVEIRGTVYDENIGRWILQYTGGESNTWQTIAVGESNINEDVLATWDTSELPDCPYTIRLIASDKSSVNCGLSSNGASDMVTFNVGDCSQYDADGDGDVDLYDYEQFLGAFTGALP